jgi:hypothetical protein
MTRFIWRSFVVCAIALAIAQPVSAYTTPAQLAAAVAAAHRDGEGRVQIDVHFDCSLAAPTAALADAGLAVTSTVHAGTLCVVEGWALPAALPQLDAVAGVTRLSAPSYARPPAPRALQPVQRVPARAAAQKQGAGAVAIDHNGIVIIRADQFVTQTGTNGTGVTVGVQSSGVYSLATIQGRGELPAAVAVVYPSGSNSSAVTADEGTVLLEEVHAVAPGASLVYCNPLTFVDYTSCLTQLINAGATIVLDDNGFPNDGLMSQDNDETSAITQILGQHPTVMMFSAAGNNDGSYWEGTYSPVSVSTTTLPPLSCPSGAGTPDNFVAAFGTGTSQTLGVSDANTFALLLAWADPPTQLTSQFDVFWFAAGSTTPVGCFSTVGATTDQVIESVTLPAGNFTLVVASADQSAAGKFLKLWAGGDGLTTLSVATAGGLISPQAMAPGVLSIGAVNGSDGIGDSIESFSSSGPVTVEFPAPAQLQAPALVAPDGIVVDASGTYFEQDLFPDGNFYGTSAAVPNAAAVAALLRADFPTLTVAQITNALQSGATAFGGTVPNGVFGYGRVDALGALATIPTPTITALSNQASTGSASTTAQPFNVTGTGPLHFSVSSNNTALVPNSIVAAGTAGVTISAGCGTTTLSCTLSVTPVTGQAGTAVVTVSALDGANRAATSQVTLTETDPAPGTSTSTGGGTASTGSGHSGGGGMQGWALLLLGVLLAWSQRRQRNATQSST